MCGHFFSECDFVLFYASVVAAIEATVQGREQRSLTRGSAHIQWREE